MAGHLWPSRFRPVLTQLVADGQHYFGSDSIAVEPIREMERPFSTLLHVRVAGDSGSQGAYIKILKPRADTPAQIASMRQNVTRDFEMTGRVREALASCAGLTAVRPIACFPEELAIVTGEAVGPTLSSLLARHAAGWPRADTIAELSGVLRQVGAWLKAAQRALPQDRDVDLDAVRAYLGTRLDDLERIGPVRLTTAGRRGLERYRNRLISSTAARDLRSVWIHADFCPDNIITDDGRLTVLDFLMAKTGTVYHDIAHLHLHLGAMTAKPWFRPAVIGGLQRDLLEAFEPGLDATRPLFALMLLQHVICRLVTLQNPGPGRAARLHQRYLHRRYRLWLARVAGLPSESWSR